MSELESSEAETSSHLVTPAPKPLIRILALCDSPLVTTGFARVDRNILGRWCKRPGVEVRCWAIHFAGWDYDLSPFKLFPGGEADWNSTRKLGEFLTELNSGDYTHVWILMDPSALVVGQFAEQFRRICKEKNIRSMLYFPADSAQETDWMPMVASVDVAVAYTEYGREQVRLALSKSQWPIEVVPHGIDEVFKPLPTETRAGYRKIELQLPAPISERNKDGRKTQTHKFLQPDDFLILNVNKNEWRKDPLRSLEILKGLREAGVPAKLIMRMAPYSMMGGVALEMAAEQLGLTYGKEWCRLDELSDEHLCGLYNAADLYLTTSMGEGWGLGVTEAMACHCPVAMPMHTSLKEIGEKIAGPIWLPMETGYVCGADTRLRQRVDLGGSVLAISDFYKSHLVGSEPAKPFRVSPKSDLKEFTWDAVAEQMWGLLTK